MYKIDLWAGKRGKTGVGNARESLPRRAGFSRIRPLRSFISRVGTALGVVVSVVLTAAMILACSTTPIHAQGAGKVLDFDGSDDFVNVPDSDDLDISPNITVEAWIYKDTAPLTNTYFLCKATGGFGGLKVESSGFFFYIYSGGWRGPASMMGLPTETWIHVAGTYNGDVIRVYVNGVEGTPFSYTGTPATGTQPLKIGRGATQWWETPAFDGKIDEVRVWKTDLDQATIQEWMNKSVTGSHPDYSDLVSYWKMDDGDGDTVTDSKGSNNGLRGDGEETCKPSWTTSTAPIGDECHMGTGTSNLMENSDVPVDIIWDGNGPGSNAIFSAIQVNGKPDVVAGLLANYALTYWELWMVDDDGSFNADVSFHYDYFNGIENEAKLSLYTRSEAGESWNVVSSYTINSEGDLYDGVGHITANNLTSFSQFILTSDDETLPVELSYFGAESFQNSIKVTWRVESELSLLHYELYREDHGIIPIWIEEGPEGGTSLETTWYEYLDMDVEDNTTYYYNLVALSLDGSVQEYGPVSCTFCSKEGGGMAPPPIERSIKIEQNKPNPFNPLTHIAFYLPEASPILIDVYDLQGRFITNLLDSALPEGDHEVVWNGTNQHGEPVASNVYIYRLKTSDCVIQKRMLLLK